MSNENETVDTVESLQLQIKKLNRIISQQENRLNRAETVMVTRERVTDMLRAERMAQENSIKQAHDEITDKNEQIRIMLDNAPVGLTIFDENFKFIDCNDAILDIFGITKEFYSTFFGSAEHSPELQPDGKNSREKAMEVIKRVINGETMRLEWLHCLPDGRPLPVELTVMRIKQGDRFIVLGYLYDMREQIRLREDVEAVLVEAKQANQKLQTVMDMLPVGVRIMRIKDGALTYANEASLKIFNCKSFEDQVEGHSGFQFMPEYQPDGRKTEDVVADLFQQDSAEVEMQCLKLDGEPFIARIKSCMIDHNGDLSSLASIEDITASIKQQQLLQKIAEKEREANQTKSNFLANMSHEIRTPLNAVIGLSDLILGTDDHLDEESRYRLERINNAGATLLSTVNDILDISKIEAGKFELVPIKYDIPSMLNDTITQSLLHRGEKQIEFELNICERLPTYVFGDELRIRQILNNLLSNAFKYTIEGTVELSVNCTRDDKEDAVWLTFIVKDTGMGIRQEDINTLFDDYTQMDMAANRKIMGTGLGLPIAKRLVELMNGQIVTKSEHGKGSVFTVRIMQKHITDDTIGPEVIESLKKFHYADQKRQRSWERISLPYARVLVVDDVVTNLDVAKGLLKPYHMQIDCVTSGQASIEAILDTRVKYNAVFMDHMMPGMDGIEATKKIRELNSDYAKNIPIIALTANAVLGNEEMFLENGFQAFISKPIEIEHLDTVIREWVRDKDQEALQKQTDEDINPEQNGSKNWQALDKDIPGLNIVKGLFRFSGDKDAYIEVLRSYTKNTPPLLEASKEVDKSDLTEYETIVHGIKGSSRGIFAEEIGDMAELLEKAANIGDHDYISANNAALSERIQKLITDVDRMLEELDADNQKPKKEKPDGEALDRLSQACSDYDMNTVDEVLDELEAYSYESDGELVVWLKDNVEQMNFDEIVERLSV